MHQRPGGYMFKSITAKTCMIISAAAFAAGVVVLLTSAAPTARAEPAAQGPAVQGDQAKGAGCSAQNWPDYAQNCRFDLRGDVNEGRPIRIIAIR